MNLEAMKLLLQEADINGKIHLFSSSHDALEFIMQFTIE